MYLFQPCVLFFSSGQLLDLVKVLLGEILWKMSSHCKVPVLVNQLCYRHLDQDIACINNIEALIIIIFLKKC